ncbi:MAG: protein translocase subunit SecD [Candidatus Absconditabacterales bacterium]
MKTNKNLLYLGICILSLFIVFFVGRSFNPQTGIRSMIVTPNGTQHFRKGLDVSGGTKLVYKISYDKYEKVYTNVAELNAIKKNIEDIITKKIDGRISKLGVSDYKSYVQNMDNQRYIVVEIGGIADLDQAKELIGKTLELEFKLQSKEVPTQASIQKRKELAQGILSEVSKTPELIQKLVDGRMSENIFYNHYTGATLDQLPEFYKNNVSLADATTGKLSSLIEGKYATITSQGSIAKTGTDLVGYTFFRLIAKTTETLSGAQETIYDLEDVFVQDRETRVPATDSQNNMLNGAYFKYAGTSTSEVGEPVVTINLDDQGKDIFCNITQANINKPMAIFVGGNLLTAPNIQTKICGGTAQINGNFTNASAKQLATALNEGAMPAPLILMQEEKISPTLGVNALTGSLWAGLVGFIAIAFLIYFMYGWKKMFLTSLALAAFLAVLFALMKLSDYALSLSGIAAIILSIGMAVDANILMYERLLEERKEGKSWETAIDTAKNRSWTAIRDGQLSTGLIALILFTMGTNMFKGFGSLMMTTVILTLLFNVPFTKMLLHLFYDKKK